MRQKLVFLADVILPRVHSVVFYKRRKTRVSVWWMLFDPDFGVGMGEQVILYHCFFKQDL